MYILITLECTCNNKYHNNMSHGTPNYYNTLYYYYTLVYDMYFIYYSRAKENSICKYYLIRKNKWHTLLLHT